MDAMKESREEAPGEDRVWLGYILRNACEGNPYG